MATTFLAKRPLLKRALIGALVATAPVWLSLVAMALMTGSNLIVQWQFEHALSAIALPSGSIIVESRTEFGHLAGNGDHCDIEVAQLIQTDVGPTQFGHDLQQAADSAHFPQDRQPRVRSISDAAPDAAGHQQLSVVWFSYGNSGSLDTIDPRC